MSPFILPLLMVWICKQKLVVVLIGCIFLSHRIEWNSESRLQSDWLLEVYNFLVFFLLISSKSQTPTFRRWLYSCEVLLGVSWVCISFFAARLDLRARNFSLIKFIGKLYSVRPWSFCFRSYRHASLYAFDLLFIGLSGDSVKLLFLMLPIVRP